MTHGNRIRIFRLALVPAATSTEFSRTVHLSASLNGEKWLPQIYRSVVNIEE